MYGSQHRSAFEEAFPVIGHHLVLRLNRSCHLYMHPVRAKPASDSPFLKPLLSKYIFRG